MSWQKRSLTNDGPGVRDERILSPELRSPRAVVLEFLPGRASGGMVDALASGASARKGVEVQLLSRARIGPRLVRGGDRLLSLVHESREKNGSRSGGDVEPSNLRGSCTGGEENDAAVPDPGEGG